jgi:hypothetical protein
MAFQLYQRVKLITNKFIDLGVGINDCGYIIEIYNDDAFEIEFTKENGETLAMIVASINDIELAE